MMGAFYYSSVPSGPYAFATYELQYGNSALGASRSAAQLAAIAAAQSAGKTVSQGYDDGLNRGVWDNPDYAGNERTSQARDGIAPDTFYAEVQTQRVRATFPDGMSVGLTSLPPGGCKITLWQHTDQEEATATAASIYEFSSFGKGVVSTGWGKLFDAAPMTHANDAWDGANAPGATLSGFVTPWVGIEPIDAPWPTTPDFDTGAGTVRAYFPYPPENADEGTLHVGYIEWSFADLMD